jgi:hypothetical protein
MYIMNQLQMIRIGVVAALVIYVVYLAFKWKNQPLVDTTNLLAKQNVVPITDNPSSVNYTYSAWIYVNVFPQGQTTNIKLISRLLTASDTENNQFEIMIKPATPTLTVKVMGSATTDILSLDLTTNFPLQKWTYVAVSVTSSVVDAYLDGKLVSSKAFSNTPKTPSTTVPMTIGNSSNLADITLSNISRLSRESSPDEVWNRYISGNGNWWTYLGLSAYNATVSVKKDGAEEATVTLF